MFVGPAAAQEAAKAQPTAPRVKAVLELFTSQGCSSCPAADALLEKYAARPDVIALSMPVDYWDYLGWKDTLASPKFTARQKNYARERGDGRVYTPQVVVNGITHAVGSSASAIDAAISTTEKEVTPSRVPVRVHVDGNRLLIEAGDAPQGSALREATVWLATVHKESVVKIERGENSGRTVAYHNVVRDLSAVGMWSGKAETLTISRDAVAEPGNEMCVVLLQVGKAGPIIGAAIDKLL
ncbi:MAG: DUF1223 domain-containing protein [Proteobacteria bacterium]|nr:DUF1223 domain-containing protein [Pseudomonadota bacterium]